MSPTVFRPVKVRVRVIRETAFVPMTPRKREICLDFGIPPREEPQIIADGLDLELRPGSILLVTGPSGSGKTSILANIAEQVDSPLWVGDRQTTSPRPIVDGIAPGRPLATALEILTACGLGEPRLWIRRYADLSDGEKFRASLARAIGWSITSRRGAPIICDEFTSLLHRRAARAIAHNLRKLVSRHRLIFIAAAAQDDVAEDLQPDETVRLGGPAPARLTHRPSDKAVSLRRRATIESGSVRDYHRFSPMHYRRRDGLGFVDKVFLLREAPKADPLGILVFAHAPRELALRNAATQGRFIRNMRRLNRELRILRRLVMHPDVRGCGLGHWFVRQALPKVGVRFVECLAVMGAVNPVFERAGMIRIGRCPMPAGRWKLLERLRDMKLDPLSPDFSQKVARYPRIRAMVEKTLLNYVAAMHGGAHYKVRGRAPQELTRAFRQIIGEPPIYYLWDREREFPRTDCDASKNRPHERAEPDEADDPGSRATRRRHNPDRSAA